MFVHHFILLLPLSLLFLSLLNSISFDAAAVDSLWYLHVPLNTAGELWTSAQSAESQQGTTRNQKKNCLHWVNVTTGNQWDGRWESNWQFLGAGERMGTQRRNRSWKAASNQVNILLEGRITRCASLEWTFFLNRTDKSATNQSDFKKTKNKKEKNSWQELHTEYSF